MANVYTGENVEEFIFGEGTTYEEACKKEETTPAAPEADEVEESVTDEEMNVFGVIECVDEPEVAFYRIALENEQNYNMIMNAMMSREFSVLESTGSEMVYEAANVEGFFNAVKAAIQKFWSKVMGAFKKVTEWISNNINANKAFVKMYKGKQMQKPTKEKEFEGFKFNEAKDPEYDKIIDKINNLIDPNSIGNMTEEEADATVEKFKEKFEAGKNEMRAIACGKSGEVSADEYEKELKLAYFGSDEKVKLELEDFSKLINELENAIGAKKKAKETFKIAKAVVGDLHNDVNKASRELKKAEGRKNSGMKVAKCLTDAINASITIMAKALSYQTNAIVTKSKQDRAMAAFYVTHQPKAEKTPKAESAVIDDLGIVLI